MAAAYDFLVVIKMQALNQHRSIGSTLSSTGQRIVEVTILGAEVLWNRKPG